MVVGRIACRVQKRRWLGANDIAQVLNRRAVGLELGAIAPTEFTPPFRFVTEPCAQFRAGRDFLEPDGQGSGLFAHAARPEPVDQDPQAILLGRQFVDPLYLQCWHLRSVKKQDLIYLSQTGRPSCTLV